MLVNSKSSTYFDIYHQFLTILDIPQYFSTSRVLSRNLEVASGVYVVRVVGGGWGGLVATVNILAWVGNRYKLFKKQR